MDHELKFMAAELKDAIYMISAQKPMEAKSILMSLLSKIDNSGDKEIACINSICSIVKDLVKKGCYNSVMISSSAIDEYYDNKALCFVIPCQYIEKNNIGRFIGRLKEEGLLAAETTYNGKISVHIRYEDSMYL